VNTSTPPSVEPKARLFRGFAEPSRLLIAEALRSGERTVSEICQATGLSQPNASNHLACLLGCRLVSREPRGRFVYYRLADDRIDALLSLGEEIASGAGVDEECCPVCGSQSW
jgi:DNA-binding transcriptional ArsR family regulator